MGLIARYMAITYARSLGVVLLLLLSAVYLLDTLELLRRLAPKDVPLSSGFWMGLLKLPEVGLKLIPFGILFAALYTFWRLTRTQELIVIRSVGLSVWRFLTPVIVLTLAFGILQITALGPITGAMLARYQQVAARVFSDRSLTEFRDYGFFVREPLQNGYAIVTGRAFDLETGRLRHASVSFFRSDGTPTGDRLIARRGRLEPAAEDAPAPPADATAPDSRRGLWRFEEVHIARPNQSPRALETLAMRSSADLDQLRQALTDPDTLSVWDIGDRLDVAGSTGVPDQTLRLALQSLLAKPLLYAATVLLAAAFTVRNPRQGNPLRLIGLGLVTCFGLYFLNDMATTLGTKGTVPVFLAAWSPAIIALALGLSLLLFLEDG